MRNEYSHEQRFLSGSCPAGITRTFLNIQVYFSVFLPKRQMRVGIRHQEKGFGKDFGIVSLWELRTKTSHKWCFVGTYG